MPRKKDPAAVELGRRGGKIFMVDLQRKNAVDKQAVYVCDQDPVVWKPAVAVEPAVYISRSGVVH
jgi:hypothetical protein